MAENSLKPIPYDAFTMAAVADEIRPFIGGKVQEIRQPTDTGFAMELYGGEGRAWLLFSIHALFARVHFTARRPETANPPPTFVATLRARLEGARLAGVTQIAADRVLRFDFETATGPHSLVAEIMGKHSNVVLVDASGRVVAALRWVPSTRSVRPILSGKPYELPPVLRDAEDITANVTPREARARTGGRFVEGLPTLPEAWEPVTAGDHGAYPVPVDALGYVSYPRPSLSLALDAHFAEAERNGRFHTAKAALETQIARLRASRGSTLRGLIEVQASGLKAGEWTRTGELILAYQYAMIPGDRELAAFDYDGTPVSIPLDTDLTPAENATLLFDRAKRARARSGELTEQIARFREDLARLESFARALEETTTLKGFDTLQDEARKRKWTVRPSPGSSSRGAREERPYDGHKIREGLSPAGYPVLWGENASANDYLTVRVARPSDLWFHARGITSAHVILRTGGKPDRVQRPDLEFAAAIAARNSGQKHSSMVAVDVTQKRYVRRQKGAPLGTVAYDHERTLHIAPPK